MRRDESDPLNWLTNCRSCDTRHKGRVSDNFVVDGAELYLQNNPNFTKFHCARAVVQEATFYLRYLRCGRRKKWIPLLREAIPQPMIMSPTAYRNRSVTWSRQIFKSYYTHMIITQMWYKCRKIYLVHLMSTIISKHEIADLNSILRDCALVVTPCKHKEVEKTISFDCCCCLMLCCCWDSCKVRWN
jgi:hypothetical protein